MKILAVSDQVVERLYSLVPQGHFTGVEMILGCGDLPYSYLEFIVSMLNVQMLYVPGNHDPAAWPTVTFTGLGSSAHRTHARESGSGREGRTAGSPVESEGRCKRAATCDSGPQRQARCACSEQAGATSGRDATCRGTPVRLGA